MNEYDNVCIVDLLLNLNQWERLIYLGHNSADEFYEWCTR